MDNTRVHLRRAVEGNGPALDEGAERARRWITAEYSMLLIRRSRRKARDISKGKIAAVPGDSAPDRPGHARGGWIWKSWASGPSGSIATCCRPTAGTRTRRITGRLWRLSLAVRKLQGEGKIDGEPLVHAVAAVSRGHRGWPHPARICVTSRTPPRRDMNLVNERRGRIHRAAGSGEEATSERRNWPRCSPRKTGIRELLTAQRRRWLEFPSRK